MADTEFAGKDVEKYAANNGDFENTGAPSYAKEEQMRRGSVTAYHDSFFSAFHPASFKRNRNARVVSEATDADGRPLKDQPPAEPALAMKLKERHLQMIAIGGSIGASFNCGFGEEIEIPAHELR